MQSGVLSVQRIADLPFRWLNDITVVVDTLHAVPTADKLTLTNNKSR